jgi:hypothetical protein
MNTSELQKIHRSLSRLIEKLEKEEATLRPELDHVERSDLYYAKFDLKSALGKLTRFIKKLEDK